MSFHYMWKSSLNHRCASVFLSTIGLRHHAGTVCCLFAETGGESAWSMWNRRTFVNSTFTAMSRTRTNIGFKRAKQKAKSIHIIMHIGIVDDNVVESMVARRGDGEAWASPFRQHDTTYLAIVLVYCVWQSIYTHYTHPYTECHLHLI